MMSNMAMIEGKLVFKNDVRVITARKLVGSGSIWLTYTGVVLADEDPDEVMWETFGARKETCDSWIGEDIYWVNMPAEKAFNLHGKMEATWS